MVELAMALVALAFGGLAFAKMQKMQHLIYIIESCNFLHIAMQAKN